MALRISKPFAEEVGIKPNSVVDISLANGKLIITPVAEPKLTLGQLLAQVNEANLHSEVESGPAMGREAW